jgi:hypothetical protein
MTDLSTALSDTSGLTAYKGRDVLRTSIAIRKAGDGLSEAMGLDPVELVIGDHVFVVLDCVVAHHDYGPIKDTDCLELKQVLNAEGATLVDEELVRKHLDDQQDRVRLARERAQGVQRLGFDGDKAPDGDEMAEAEALAAQHHAGVHDELRDGCPLCDDERAALDAEARADSGPEPTPIGKGRGRGKAKPADG